MVTCDDKRGFCLVSLAAQPTPTPLPIGMAFEGLKLSPMWRQHGDKETKQRSGFTMHAASSRVETSLHISNFLNVIHICSKCDTYMKFLQIA
jgi:hypothetical protein